MAVMFRAVDQAPRGERLTIFTDCRVLLQILGRWQRRNFGPYVEAEENFDILEQLIAALDARTGLTTLIYVRAHKGDPGNGLADRLAAQGCTADEVEFERLTAADQIYTLNPRKPKLLSPHGWRKGVETYSRKLQGEYQAGLLAVSDAKSTDSILKEGYGRQVMGAVLQDPSVTYKERRDFLQGRANCFPTATVVHCNTKGAKTEMCPLCRREPETFGHMHMRCTETEGARQEAHDMIADDLFRHVAEGMDGEVSLFLCPRVGTIGPGTYDPRVQHQIESGEQVARAVRECPTDISAWEPDTIVLHLSSQRLYVLEFTRGMSEAIADMEERDALKSQKYHAVVVYLTALYPQFQVKYHTFVMGVLTTYPEADWEWKLTQLGLPPKAREATCKSAVRQCIAAGHMVANVRRAAIALKGEMGSGLVVGVG